MNDAHRKGSFLARVSPNECSENLIVSAAVEALTKIPDADLVPEGHFFGSTTTSSWNFSHSAFLICNSIQT